MKIAIVGGGPAGLFSALKLSEFGEFQITLFDKGKPVLKRTEKEDLIFGIGGAGLFSDGKLNFSPDIGNNLQDVVGRASLINYMNEAEDIFSSFGIKAEFPDKEKAKFLQKKALKFGLKYIPIKQAHIGSDQLPSIIEKIEETLKKRGVQIKTETEVLDMEDGKIISSDGEYDYDRVVVAPGRGGARWLEKIVKKLSLSFIYNPVDVGVRVEVNHFVMDDLTSINWDPKIHIITPTYQDFLRTFCVSPYGYVVSEKHGEFVLANGHSRRDRRSENTNFAFLVSVKLTEPLENTNLYGETIAKTSNTLGGGKVILQRLGDLLQGRRSRLSTIEKSYTKPTLNDFTPGDISMALPYRILKNIIEGLERLNELSPGVFHDSTLLYAPEIKFHGLRILTDNYLRTSNPKIYVAGDGAGLSRGIVGAAVSGLIAGYGIIKEVLK